MFKSAIKEGDVKYLKKCDDHYHRPGDGKWIDAHLKLFSGGVLEVSDNKKLVLATLEKIILAPYVTASPSVAANFPNIFVVNTIDEESKFAGGPLFALPTPKEAQEWMHAINLERVRHAHQNKHPHPLTYYVPHYVVKYQSGEPLASQIVCKDDKFNCDNCRRDYEYGGAICEFCNYKICSKCEDGFKNVLSVPFVKSPNHEHNLLQFEKAEGVTWFESGYDGNFRCDKCSNPSTGIVFHCAECNYDECEKCAAEYLKAENLGNDNGEMKLNYELFKGAMKVQHDKDFLVNNSSKLSKACSIITDRSWDLSKIETEPVPHAYCEFTFKNFDLNEKVGVGIGNKIHVGNQMLGYQQNSFGYFNDGSVCQRGADEKKKYLPTFKDDDTIGVGILYDSFKQRRLFFTKNGKMLEFFPGLVHKGMDVFPGASFSKKSAVQFSVNFKGPFLFDPTSIPNYRDDCEDRLSKIPPELIATCLSYAATLPEVALEHRLISKIFAEQAVHNAVWQPLFMQKWPLQNSKLKLKSWYTLYKRRFAVDKVHKSLWDDDDDVNKNKIIENCDFEFLCPLKWSELPDGGNQNERHCDKCNKTVYRVDDEATLRSYAEKGRCVSMFKLRDRNEPFRPRMMGMPPPMPRKISNPFDEKVADNTASEEEKVKKKGFFAKLLGK